MHLVNVVILPKSLLKEIFQENIAMVYFEQKIAVKSFKNIKYLFQKNCLLIK